jgi:rSAM/selenodomain-associated transferase 1
MKFPGARLLVFSKNPVPGQVKTRLAPLLGRQGAAELYARFVHERLALTTGAKLCPVELWCSPSRQAAFFRDCAARFPISLYTQSQGDLGRRMHQALCAALDRGHSAVLIGADCPGLTQADLAEALAVLARGADVVLGPAADGGYYLIGLRRPIRSLFSGIRWGGRRVYADSVARLEQRGIAYHRLQTRDDVDTPDDYRRLCLQRTA